MSVEVKKCGESQGGTTWAYFIRWALHFDDVDYLYGKVWQAKQWGISLICIGITGSNNGIPAEHFLELLNGTVDHWCCLVLYGVVARKEVGQAD